VCERERERERSLLTINYMTESRHIPKRDDLGPPVVPGGQEIGLGTRNLRPRAEARPTGRAVSKERLGDWDGPIGVRRASHWPNGEEEHTKL
jgi:hypothetical protein